MEERLMRASLAAVFGFSAQVDMNGNNSNQPVAPVPEFNFAEDDVFDFAAYTSFV